MPVPSPGPRTRVGAAAHLHRRDAALLPLDNSRYNEYNGDVTGKILGEIGQQTPYSLLEEEVFVNLQRSADACMQRVHEALKPAGLSPTQYNVLRILRGAGEAGLPCGEIAARMITRDPDITRLLDRLEARGLVRRKRQKKDRRVIQVVITSAGFELLAGLDEPIRETHRRQFGHLSEEQLRTLIALLEEARGGSNSGRRV